MDNPSGNRSFTYVAHTHILFRMHRAYINGRTEKKYERQPLIENISRAEVQSRMWSQAYTHFHFLHAFQKTILPDKFKNINFSV